MAMLDERKIEEIVARVLERLAGSGVTPPALTAPPGGGSFPGAPVRGGASAPGEPARTRSNVPRGSNGVYTDADQAAAAARRAFEQNERTSVATKVKMVEAMRKAVLSNNDGLSRYAVEETGLGRYEDKLSK